MWKLYLNCIYKLSDNNLYEDLSPIISLSSPPYILHSRGLIEEFHLKIISNDRNQRWMRVPNMSRLEFSNSLLLPCYPREIDREGGRKAQRSWLNNIWRLPRGCRINVVVFAQQFPACSSCAVGPFAEGGGRRLMSRVSPSPSFPSSSPPPRLAGFVWRAPPVDPCLLLRHPVVTGWVHVSETENWEQRGVIWRIFWSIDRYRGE